ncbi:potassium channel family protein [Brasilonema bromeliae]|uniref:Potassium transporter TrkA n=1 Tax=Brasilonema bromeliae SPC951 TaxID=385972 RepID=A0ABX1PGY5_9CYAN|nr:NAD-binding protein [Brasilonema bromeliae]NMG22730.1 potassium transporter TrkA [Brasilonema bromeliae SPC951]
MHQAAQPQVLLDQFLVCGLGGLGQHCVVALKQFEVSVIAIDKKPPEDWEIPHLENLLDTLVIGDCRQIDVLQQAKIQQCRAAIIVTSSEQVNAETALAVRKLNPKTRLVIRSSKKNLNELLSEHLGNFVAFEPTQLPAPAFALAALGTETLGLFHLEGQWLQVVKRTLSPTDRWCNRQLLHELNTHKRHILYHTSSATSSFKAFHKWEPDTRLMPGDTIVYIEAIKPTSTDSQKLVKNTWYNPWHLLTRLKHLNWLTIKQQVTQFLRKPDQNRFKQVGIICGVIVGVLLLLGTVLYRLTYPKMGLIDAFLTSTMLLLGGFGDLFGGFNFTLPVPFWLRLISLGMTITGTILVGVFYSFLTERLLAARFQLNKRRPPVPQKDHVVVVGLGRMGQGIAEILQEFNQPLVGITLNTDFDMTVLPKMPLITGSLKRFLSKANLQTAKSVVVVTDDEMLNLEVSLMAYDANPESNLVIRTTGLSLSDNLAELLPNAQVLCVYALVAEAFAGAAFGENIINLFRINHKTILVTEYQIEGGDTLNGLLLSEVAYGYGVVPILYQKETGMAKLMPSEDISLAVGDRMIVLATSDGLQRIEQGTTITTSKTWQVHITRALTEEAQFEGANVLVRISGCSLNTARTVMKNLPQTLHLPLYKHQAQRLIIELSKAQVIAHLLPTNSL